MAAQQITQGAIDGMFNDSDRVNARFPVPVLQCLQIKTLESKGPTAEGGAAAERYRIVLSDMRNYVQCMLATQANHVVHDGLLQRGSIVRLKQYQASAVKGKNILVVIDLDVIESLGTPERIGDPVSVDLKTTSRDTTIGGAGFYGTKTEPAESKPPKPAPSYSAAPARSSATHGGPGGNSTIYPIEALSPYSHKWTIKARVTSKSDIIEWHKPNSDGKLFNVNLLDESGEIRATGFKEQCDQFYDVLQEGSVYYISSPCKVSVAKKKFSNLPNDYEMVFEQGTLIDKAEDQATVPKLRFNFCSLQGLQEIEKDSTVDVIGVLTEAAQVDQIESKARGKVFDKRELTIVDDSNFSVRATIWGKAASSFDAQPESVIAFRGMRVGDFGGRSLSLLSSGTMHVDPDIPEAHRLKGWYDASGRGETYATHSGLASLGAATGRQDRVLHVAQVQEQGLGMEGVEYFSLKATILYIKQEGFAYPACRNERCNKKVEETADGTWRCERCDVSHDRPEYRYIVSISVADHTGQMYLSCFDDVGRIIMGMSADELVEIRDSGDDARFAAIFEAANCRAMSFRVRAKMDSYNGVDRVRYQVMSAGPLDFKAESQRLTELVKQMSV